MDRVKCEECNGTGKVRDDAGSYPCPACDNSGLRPLSFADLREADKWAELRMAIAELVGETEKIPGKKVHGLIGLSGEPYAFRKALQWVLNRMDYLDQKEKEA